MIKITQPLTEILHEAEELWERQSSETSSEVGSASTGSSDIGDVMTRAVMTRTLMTPPRKPAHQLRVPPKVSTQIRILENAKK